MRAIERCRTAALGRHRDRCSKCGKDLGFSFNSCRNRHCPKCQFLARNRWVTARTRELVPVNYFHIVFTVPHQLSELMLQNKRILYDLFFRCASATLLEVAANPKRLGAEIGFLCAQRGLPGKVLRRMENVVPAEEAFLRGFVKLVGGAALVRAVPAHAASPSLGS